ncbi:MAG: phenylalanine--tRNA ligase beta subunit-related protein [Patescibacteria group bacterium]
MESAYFDPVSIRYTSRKLKTSTDASYRYER